MLKARLTEHKINADYKDLGERTFKEGMVPGVGDIVYLDNVAQDYIVLKRIFNLYDAPRYDVELLISKATRLVPSLKEAKETIPGGKQ